MGMLAVGELNQRETAMTKASPVKGTECHLVTAGRRGDQSVRTFNSIGEMTTHLRRVGAMPCATPRRAAPRELVSLVILGSGISFHMEPV